MHDLCHHHHHQLHDHDHHNFQGDRRRVGFFEGEGIIVIIVVIIISMIIIIMIIIIMFIINMIIINMIIINMIIVNMIIINMIIVNMIIVITIITTSRVSVEELEFVEESKERRSLALTVVAEPRIRSSLSSLSSLSLSVTDFSVIINVTIIITLSHCGGQNPTSGHL